MKVIWEASDICPGRGVRRPGSDETWMIGRDSSHRQTLAFALVSVNNGTVAAKGLNREQVALLLNTAGGYPTELV